VDLHHKVYGNYGKERDEDLVPLCKKHHSAFHDQHGVQRNMTGNTTAFVHAAAFEEEAAHVMHSIAKSHTRPE
jgi:O-glycosyl hydrolase